MKKILLVVVMASFLLSGCFISRIFGKKDKVGCPTDGRNVGAEKLLSGDPKAEKAARKAKWRGGK
jgi:flagellar basal body-associated protein FliL